jgi:hypothetical protein
MNGTKQLNKDEIEEAKIALLVDLGKYCVMIKIGIVIVGGLIVILNYRSLTNIGYVHICKSYSLVTQI